MTILERRPSDRSGDRHLDPISHPVTLSWYWPHHSLSYHSSTERQSSSTHINFDSAGFRNRDLLRRKPVIYRMGHRVQLRMVIYHIGTIYHVVYYHGVRYWLILTKGRERERVCVGVRESEREWERGRERERVCVCGRMRKEEGLTSYPVVVKSFIVKSAHLVFVYLSI